MISPCANPLVLRRASAFSARVDLSADLSARAEELTGAGMPAGLTSAILRRKTEYVAGRHCAREALVLARLGIVGAGGAPVPAEAMAHARAKEAPGLEGRLPVWPSGFVGSITHKGGFVAAAAARDRVLRGVGIDSEKQMLDVEAMKLRESIASAKEREYLRGLAEADAVRGHAAAGPGLLYTVLFTAKESLYKALFPSVRVFFGFMDAEIAEITGLAEAASWSSVGAGGAGSFRMKLLRGLSADFPRDWECEGRFAVGEGWVHAGIEIPA